VGVVVGGVVLRVEGGGRAYSSQTWGGLAVGELAGILSSDILGKAAGIVGQE